MLIRYFSTAMVLGTAWSGAAQTAPEVPPLGPENSFPFVLPWDARPTGTAADASDLNEAPAGKNGWITVRGGRFVESGTGRRVRFFGTNVGTRAAFPDKADAPLIARRMRVLGINLVRFHHLNNGWDAEGTIWRRDRMFVEIDPVQLDKLDWFVACLKKEGIYTNLNLQTAREYVPELGFPDSVRQIPNFMKKIDKVDRRMIDLQKEYARDLLDRVNPYTGLRYRDDPALLKIEINNENSLVGWPGESPGAGLASLPEPFRGQVIQSWNRWLVRRYRDDGGLRRAWRAVDTLTGPELATTANAWTHENQSNSDVRYTVEPDGRGPGVLTAEIREHAGPDWHVQAHVPGLNLVNGQTYTVSFETWSDVPMAFEASARLDKADWRFVGLGSTVQTGPSWRRHHLVFTPSDTEPNHTRIGFTLGRVRGTVKFRNFSVRRGEFAPGASPEDSIERGTVGIPASDRSQRSRDWLQFLTETEAAYTEEMRRFLVRDLGFRRALIIDTQVSWGGTTSFLRERNSPFRDDHAYWNHPTFLGGDWDPRNYRVDRRALVDEFSPSRGYGTLGSLALARVAGVPHSVSEYNHPAPSDFQVEMMPLYAAWAARQDWDAIYTFAWDDTSSGAANDAYTNYFDMALNPAKSAFFPMSAYVFRAEAVPAATASTILSLGREPWQRTLSTHGSWPTPRPDAGRVRLGQQLGGTPGTVAATGGEEPPFFVQEAGEGGAIVSMRSPAFGAAVGFVQGRRVDIGVGTAEFGRFGAGFAALTVNALGTTPVAQADRVLVTLGARVENQGMGWNAERTSVSDQWGTGPTRAEAVPATLRLRMDGPRRVYALTADHRRGAEIPAAYRDGVLEFRLDRSTATMWAEVVKR